MIIAAIIVVLLIVIIGIILYIDEKLTFAHSSIGYAEEMRAGCCVCWSGGGAGVCAGGSAAGGSVCWSVGNINFISIIPFTLSSSTNPNINSVYGKKVNYRDDDYKDKGCIDNHTI